MERDKQIEEMAKTVCHLDRTCDECMTSFECKAMTYAKRFYNAGYRKASYIVEEIESLVDKHTAFDGYIYAPLVKRKFAELKKKYTEGKDV